VIVGGRYTGAPEEGKEKFLLGSCEIGPEGLGGFETKRLFTDVVELRDEAFFDLGRCLPGISPDLSFSPASQSREHRSMTPSQKGPVAVSFSVWRQERMFPTDFLGLCEDMGYADLPVHSDTVIGCIAVAHQRPVIVLSENGFCHLCRPMPVYMKEGEVFITCEPYKMPHAVTAP